MPANELTFPAGFLWGAATSAHQTEGNNVNSDWWAREHAPGTSTQEPSGDACDSYHRYGEDIALLADLGFNTYRFSLEWARIEPEQGFVSRAALDHYRRMVTACHEAGLTPMVTLHHFTVPRWFARRGGWQASDAPDLFARFTEAVLPVLADGVEWVCTINEPNIVARGVDEANENLPNQVYALPDPGVSQTLVLAHRKSRTVLSALTGVKSGWTIATQAFQPEPGSEQIAHIYGYPREDFFLEAARGDDFIGVQAYTRTVIGPDGPKPPGEDAEKTLKGWEYYPPAVGQGIRNAWNLTGGVSVIVTENGIATSDDSRRVAYTTGALTAVHEAMTDGIDVRGYLHWSALDNYEWGSFRPTFGLIAVDRQTFARTPKTSAHWLGQVAKSGRLTLDASRQ
ncbi:glycoside hydrolase family 1 protein [Streptomyces sp. NPDC002659]|uniref:glycoside hydrolase family 1 protein n=1 Tax=Streptomyces sp. NPDC002659 TaxID=3364656 RepID=UPI0036AD7A4B